jgi:uracil-DNA glycosylase
MHESWNKLFDQYDFNLEDIYSETTYPPKEQIFKVFAMPVNDIQLVFLGQDPYHRPNQAHGLSFSVEVGVDIPPSLKNIFKELNMEFSERSYDFTHGNLEKWEGQGIFLLNTSLTVLQGKPNSHSKIWKEFTDDVIKYIAERNKNCIFLLLGNNAKEKIQLVENKDRIITGVHPSPLSASRGFFHSNIFKEVEKKVGKEIDWSN